MNDRTRGRARGREAKIRWTERGRELGRRTNCSGILFSIFDIAVCTLCFFFYYGAFVTHVGSCLRRVSIHEGRQCIFRMLSLTLNFNVLLMN